MRYQPTFVSLGTGGCQPQLEWLVLILELSSALAEFLSKLRGFCSQQVLPPLLGRHLHPTAVAGFLLTPQSELRINGQPQAVKDWLLHGESV